MNRRTLLRAVGSAGIVGLSGCLDRLPTVGETTLGWFAVYNLHQERGHQFDVRVERDGTVVHESSHQLEAHDPESDAKSPPHAVLDCTWDPIAGDYTVVARSDGREWQRFDIVKGELRPPDCVIAYLQYGDLHGPSDDPPSFEYVLDETDCTEVASLAGGCPEYE